MRPLPQEYASFYGKYIEIIAEEEALSAVENSLNEAQIFLATIPEAKADFRYAAGKWTVKELLQHITDTERIMAYRALCIARKEHKDLPGFDENAYVDALDLSNRSIKEIQEEFLELKRSTNSLFRSFPPEALQRLGTMNGQPASVGALGYIIAGHQRHHFKVLREKYL